MSTLRGFIIAAIITALVALGVFFIVTREGPPSSAPTGTEDPASSVQEQVVRSAPAFDIVRIETDGTAVIAGTSEAGASVNLMIDDQVIATAKSDANGSWSMVIQQPLPSGNIEMYLLATTPDGQGIRSKHVVIVAIPEARDRLPLVVLGAPGGASRVLQDPEYQPSSGELALEVIDYDREGGVIFSGQAKPGSLVRVLSDGSLIGEDRADETGRWSIISREPLAVGVHNLQIDQLEITGRVSAVLMVPFERADPDLVARLQPGTIIVQPGNSLWRIARQIYGQGWQYTQIYSANQDQIRDPDLIYPGQVFDIPVDER
ncbi:MAG: LysM peptidoglycan-binding domain-containing protein [Robiginitomaculum sp.]|nr:LysM peptidoglycan-binding domain-containing protein [Robiginitomaculum sp.]